LIIFPEKEILKRKELIMIRTLSKSIREYKMPSILSPVFVAMEVVFECIIPLVMASLIDHMNGSSMKPILYDGLILIGLSMCSLFCGRMAAIEAAKASCGFAKNLRFDMFSNIQSFSFQDIDKFSTSSLVTRMTTDVTNVQNAYGQIIRGLVRAPLMIIFSIVMALGINARMSLIFIFYTSGSGICSYRDHPYRASDIRSYLS
jgi:ATP-binding cassette subfamily B multidrug efflux pump